MFAVIGSFKVLTGEEQHFIKGWKGLTEHIYQYENSLGSLLHKASDGLHIAYAQWPDQATWQHAGGNLPESAQPFREMMQRSCSEIKTLYELEMTDDLLREMPFGGDEADR